MEAINRVLQIREGKLALYYLAGVSGWLLFSNELINLLFSDAYLLLTLKNVNTWILAIASFGFLTMMIHGVWYRLQEKDKRIEQLLEERKLVVDLEKSELHDTLMRIFRKAPAPMAILTGESHTYEFANESYVRTMGQKKMVGKTVRQILPEAAKQGILEKLDRVYRSGKPHYDRGHALRIKSPGGIKTVYRDVVYNPMTDGTGEVYGIFVQFNDITDRVKAQKKLEQKLVNSKHFMDRLQDRTLGNFAIAQALFHLQSEETHESDTHLALEHKESRLQTLANIQELMGENGNVEQVPFHAFLHRHIKWLFNFYGRKQPDLHLLIDELPMDLDRAIAMGLVLNEVLFALVNCHHDEFSKMKVRTDSSDPRQTTLLITVNLGGDEIWETLDSVVSGRQTSLTGRLLRFVNAELEHAVTPRQSVLVMKYTDAYMEQPLIDYLNDERVRREISVENTPGEAA
ncbi:MAG: PAS domain-containing protein [Balneolaceae bacterium]|nr:PAS domain-containing protein [Balneolaceae bacterium]